MTTVNRSRLLSRLHTLSQIGQDPKGGITRPFGSQADLEAREWFCSEATEAGLICQTDAAANIWAILPGPSDGPMIGAGSHIDTVPQGGAYDGALGVLMALESLHTLRDDSYANRHPMAAVVFTAEEPNPFNLSTLGSRLITRRLAYDHVKDVPGLSSALHKAGGDIDRLSTLSLPLAAFIEPHIEQGPRLDQANCPLAVVQGITGIYRERVIIRGEQNHAGTTPMALRHDAVKAFAEAVLRFHEVLDAEPSDAVGTIAYVSVNPNAVNVIPSTVEFIAEIRSPHISVLNSLMQAFRTHMQTLDSGGQGVSVTTSPLLCQAPSVLDPAIQQILMSALGQRQVPFLSLTSMAGHDATHLAASLATGMLFIRSKQGKSHCPEEWSHPDDIVLGAQILTDVLMQLDQAQEERV